MGWTVYYEASSTKADIHQFVAAANEANLGLSENSETYQWRAEDAHSASYKIFRGFGRMSKSLSRTTTIWTIVTSGR